MNKEKKISQIESGVELFARLNTKPSLKGIDEVLFPDGLCNTDTVEISGDASTGKSLFLAQMIGKCLLPEWQGLIKIGGCNAHAVLINVDHHLQISKLNELMYAIVENVLSANSKSQTLDIGTINHIVNNSLRNLTILDCYDNDQLFLTLQTLENVFLSNNNVALLAIDGITAHYWQERRSNDSGYHTFSIRSYAQKLLKIIHSHCSRFNIVTMYTYPEQTYTEDKRTRLNVEYKIFLQKWKDSQKHLCTLNIAQTRKILNYTILATGIKWDTVGQPKENLHPFDAV